MIKVNNKAYSERIILSSECNYKCAYCYQKNKKHLMMSREIATKRINYIKEYAQTNPDNDICLNLFGGEPMLNWDVFKLIVDTFSSYEKVYISTITNGSFLTNDKINYLKDKNIKIHISLDGNAVSNLMRVGLNKKQTHPIVENVIKKLIASNIFFAVNLTIGKNNQRFIKQSLDYLKALGVKEVHLQFMTYVSYRITEQNIEDIVTYAEKIRDDDFCVVIGLLKKANDIESIKASSLDKSFEKEILFEKWTHSQADGFSYEFVGCIGTGFSDDMAFCLNKEMDLSKSKILSYTDNLSEEHVVLKTLEDL